MSDRITDDLPVERMCPVCDDFEHQGPCCPHALTKRIETLADRLNESAIRPDIHNAIKRERDDLRAEVERLKADWDKVLS